MTAPTTRETADHAELATNEKLRQLSAWNSYVESKPAQQRAHQKVKYAVEKGRLIVPEVCSECDQHAGYAKDGRRLLQAHHDDYSKPLDVRWLCIPCHRAITPVNPHRGSSAVTAEIMEEDAIYIRSSCRSHIELSEMFGVDHSAIRQVRRGATWAHVPTYENLLSEIAALRGERDRLRTAVSKSNDEICQSLGKALGYPWFKDDQANFPGSTESDGVCVGDHVAESIADEASRRLTQAERQRDEARDTIASTVAKADWMQGQLSGERSSIDRETIELVVSECRAYCHLQALATQGADQ